MVRGHKEKPQQVHGLATHNWPKNILFVCLFVEAWLIFFHFYLANHETPSVLILGQAFDVTRESSLPTFWSSLLAMAAAGTAFCVWLAKRKSGSISRQSIGWMLAAGLFFVISVDDAMGFHERVGAITSLDAMNSIHYSSYPWHIVVAPIFAVGLLSVALLIWRDLCRIEGLRPMFLMAVGCFGAAVLLDYFEGLEQMAATVDGWPVDEGKLQILMLVEEVVEIAGTTIFLFVFFSYLCHLIPEVGLHRREVPATAEETESGASDRSDRPAKAEVALSA